MQEQSFGGLLALPPVGPKRSISGAPGTQPWLLLLEQSAFYPYLTVAWFYFLSDIMSDCEVFHDNNPITPMKGAQGLSTVAICW
jgi:hypothetical protein